MNKILQRHSILASHFASYTFTSYNKRLKVLHLQVKTCKYFCYVVLGMNKILDTRSTWIQKNGNKKCSDQKSKLWNTDDWVTWSNRPGCLWKSNKWRLKTKGDKLLWNLLRSISARTLLSSQPSTLHYPRQAGCYKVCGVWKILWYSVFGAKILDCTLGTRFVYFDFSLDSWKLGGARLV